MVKRARHKSFLTLPKVCQGDSIKPCQKVFYLPLEQLEQNLLGVFYANDFNQRMGRVI